MENTITKLNYNQPNSDYYTAYQLILPLDLEKKIDKTDPVYSFLEVVEGANLIKYISKPSSKGRNDYDPFKMLKVVLFAYMNQIYSLRKIASACKTDIRFMYIMQEETPSHMAFQRFINTYLKDDIESIFRDIFNSISTLDDINKNVVYIDGTKMEANANKFSFIWKKTAISTRDKTFTRLNDLVDRLVDGINAEKKDFWTPDDIDVILSQLEEKAKKESIEFVYGKGKRKTPLQRNYDDLNKLKATLESCLERIDLCGPNRNSCSKTDHDATMMHMKEDYYMKTGIFKPGYNVQVAVSDGYIQYASIFQDRADQRTLMSFLDEFNGLYGRYPKTVVADAGYGSYDNYFYCLEHNIEAYIKYTMYSKEKEKKYQKDIFKKANWPKNENGEYVCPAGHAFHFISETEDKRSRYPRINQRHSCGKCEGCPLKAKCTKAKGNREIKVNPILEEFENKAKEMLDSPEGIQYRIQRSIQSEGAFGVIKADYQYARFHRKSQKNVKLEFLLISIGYNLAKYHNRKSNRKIEA